MSNNKKFQQPGGFNEPSKVPQQPQDVKSPFIFENDAQPAVIEKIVVIALQELPFFKGKRIPAGMEFEIASNQFNEKLMAKK